jgi:hypothetical protein
MGKKTAKPKNRVVFKTEEDSDHEEVPQPSQVSSQQSQPPEKTLKISGTFGLPDEESGDSDGLDGDLSGSDASDGGAELFSGEEAVSVDLGDQAVNNDPVSVEERRKQRRIEKLEKRIKALQKKKDKADGPKREKFEREAAEIKNKHKR